MKKIFVFLLSLLLSVTLVACKDKNKNNVVAPNEIQIIGNQATMLKGEELQLTAKVLPEGADQRVIWSSSDENVLNVDDNGKVTAVGAGLAEIIVISRVKNNVQKRVAISVSEPVVYADPEEIVVTSTRQEVAVGSFINLSIKVLPENASQEVLWESSNNEIATVSGGRVTGMSVGDVIITVKTIANPEIKTTIPIKVVEANDDATDVEPTEIKINGENEVVAGFSIYLIVDILPYGASLNVFWSSSNENIAVVDAGGKVTGISEGKVTITATSARDTSVKNSIEITVLPYIEFTDIPNLQGYTIKILTDQGRIHEYYPFSDGYVAGDKYARMKAWQEVETKYNCKIVFGEYPDSAPWGPGRVTWVNQNAAKNSQPADIMILTTQWLSDLVNGNAVVDVTEYYEKYGRNQLPPDLRQSGSLKGKLYTLLSYLPGGIYVDQGLFYNLGLIEKYNLESPAVIFNRGEWTYSTFLEYVQTASAVLAEDETVLSGSPTLYWMGMTHAAGVKLLDTNNLTVNFKNQYARQAASILRQAYQISWGDIGVEEKVTSFQAGKSIFQSGEYWFVKDSTRFPKDLWGDDTRYGYVPYPRPDTLNKSETRTNLGVGPAYMMVKGVANRPSYVTEEAIYMAWSEINLNTIKYLDQDPEFNIDVAMKRAASYKIDDEASLDAIAFFKRDKLVFDPIIYGVVGYYSMTSTFDPVITEGKDFNQAIDEVYNEYRQKLVELYG